MTRKLAFAADDIENIAAFGRPEALQFTPGSNAASLGGLLPKIIELRRKFAERFDAIGEDPNLSEQGMAAARRALAASTMREIGEVGSGNGFSGLEHALVEMARRRDKKQADIDAVGLDENHDSPAASNARSYIWGLLAAKDPLERGTIFADAIRDRDEQTYGAFVRAPRLLRLLEPTALAEGVAAWNAQTHPAGALEVRELGLALEVVKKGAASARSFVAQAGGLPESDPLQQVAAGEPPASL